RLGAGASSLRAPAAAVAIVAIAAVTLPRGFTVGVGAGTDNSWMAAIAMAAHDGLVFGRDVVFTYGPLGWLGTGRLAYPVQGTFAFAFALATHVAAVAAVALGLRRSLGWPGALLGALALMSFVRWLAPNDEPQVAVVAVAAVAAVAMLRRAGRAPLERRRVLAFAVAGGVFAALELLIKLNTGATIAAIAGVTALALDPRPPWRAALVFAATLLVAVVVLWLTAAGQPLGALDDYVRMSLEIVDGHPHGLMTEESIRGWEYLAALVIAGVAAATAFAATAGWRLAYRAGAFCVLAVLLFTSFKQGFIRHDQPHAIQFFALAAFGVAAFGFAPRRITALAFATVLVALIAVVRPPPAELAAPRESWTAFRESVAAVARGEEGIADNRDEVRGSMKLDERTVALVTGHTVHVAPIETSLVFGYPEFRWRPLPVFQAYVTYTPALDELNADLLRSARAPEFILRQEEFAPFSQPATQLAMLCRYHEVHRANGWQVLRRGENRCGGPPELIVRAESTTTGPGVAIPAATPGRIVVARLRGLEPDLGERVRSVLLKPYDRWAYIDDFKVGFVQKLFAEGVIAAVPAELDYAAPFSLGWDAETLSVATSGTILPPQEVPDRPYGIEFWAVPLRG
ncbi:MAG TPA: hypothetical protein VN213_01340, partial [Solirubrobacteraceae bacterium]|nr:hypothetical protein [Solirubrobacteraceae bacterium]